MLLCFNVVCVVIILGLLAFLAGCALEGVVENIRERGRSKY